MTAICAGCATSASPPLERSLPPPPAFMAQVAVPGVRAGDDARVVLARTRAALGEANARLGLSADWYAGLRSDVGGEQ